MNSFWNDNGTKVLGYLTAALASVAGLISIDAFDGLLAETTTRWMAIVITVLTGGTGLATAQRGHSNTAQLRVAEKFSEALNTPPPKQGGFARIGVLLAVAIAALVLLAGCQVNPQTGRQELTETGKVLLQSTASIATRRYLRDHPGRAVEIAANIRAVAADLHTVTDVTTVSELRVRVEAEIAKRTRDPLNLQDAQDLLDVFEVLLREQLGKDQIDGDALVRVNEFAEMIVRSLPPLA